MDITTLYENQLVLDDSANGLEPSQALLDSITREGFWMNVDGAILVTPLDSKYLVVTGRRRLKAARMCGITKIPCFVSNMMAKELILSRIVSNCQNRFPLVKTVSEKLKVAAQIMGLGGNQKDFRTVFGDTTGPKLFDFLTLDQRFPKLRILDRLLDGSIRYEDHRQVDLGRLVIWSDTKSLEWYNELKKTHRELITEEEMCHFFS